MWFILGMIVLLIATAIVSVVVVEKTNNKLKILIIGYIIGGIVTFIIGCRCFKPEIEKYENKVNELTTKLYESYSLIDSFEQQIPIDVLKEDK